MSRDFIRRHAFRYKNNPQIKAMTDLVDAYQRREVHTAEKIIRGEHLPRIIVQEHFNLLNRQSRDHHG